MAVLVFYGGAGVNIISYCCNQCRSAGVEVLLKDKCCEIHDHNHSHTTNKHAHHSGLSCCIKDNQMHQHDNETQHVKSCNSCMDHASSNCCNMERINFDWNTQNTSELDVDLSPVAFDLLSSEIPDIFTINILISEAGTSISKGPPLECPRDYLSYLTVLLI